MPKFIMYEEDTSYKQKILISIIYISFILWTKILFQNNIDNVFEYRINPKLVIPIILLLTFIGIKFLSRKIQQINNINIMLKLSLASVIITFIFYIVDYIKEFQNVFVFNLLTFLWVIICLMFLTLMFDFFSKKIKYNKVFELLGYLLILTKIVFSLIQLIEYNFQMKNYDLNIAIILSFITVIALFFLKKVEKNNFAEIDKTEKDDLKKYKKINEKDGNTEPGIWLKISKLFKEDVCLEVFIIIMMIIILNIFINMIDGYLLIYLFEVNQIGHIDVFYGNIFAIDLIVSIIMFFLIKFVFYKNRHLDVLMVIFLTCLSFGVILLIIDMKVNTIGYFLISISYLFLDLYLWTIIIKLPKIVKLSKRFYFFAVGAYIISISIGKIIYIYFKNRSVCLLICLIGILICFVIFYVLQQYYNEVLIIAEKKYKNNNICENNNQINIGLEVLTEKETEIVKLMLKGLKNKEIASTVFISENTLKTHARNIYQKLNVNNKKELIEKNKFLLK